MKFSQDLLFDFLVSVCHSTLSVVIKPLAHTHTRGQRQRETSSFNNAVWYLAYAGPRIQPLSSVSVTTDLWYDIVP